MQEQSLLACRCWRSSVCYFSTWPLLPRQPLRLCSGDAWPPHRGPPFGFVIKTPNCRAGRVGSASPAKSHGPMPASRASEVPPAAVPPSLRMGVAVLLMHCRTLHGRVPYPARTPIQYRLRDGREDAGPARIPQLAAVVAEEGVLDAEVNRETLAVLAARRTARRTASVLCTDSYSALGVRFKAGLAATPLSVEALLSSLLTSPSRYPSRPSRPSRLVFTSRPSRAR
ncbi:hypothetical protein B0T26DRAFT_81883 [Lasiosphaeria miniovina]|uniref:Uncharacterized protein n=1 Tax=Lasiosphaeria miniovina TaxID=1954250 RepID=A0AA40EAV5_9PEZI|nr:uncharacterized protein B0T26DRAFT_81883 [Lasiosphaeria miniovina]KAK0734809.1 hypothetical protein B0T26DRAFT_81883 [Lasiosphaeria miniovina]